MGYEHETNGFFQEEFIEKYSRDLNSAKSLYRINCPILEHAGHTVSKVYRRTEYIPLRNKSLAMDCQVFNLIHHFKNVPHKNERIVIDYSNLGHRTLNHQDIFAFNHFMRSVVKIFRFNRRHNITELWSSKSYWESQSVPLSETYWKNKFLHSETMASLAKSFF
jgi:hypothetical protein